MGQKRESRPSNRFLWYRDAGKGVKLGGGATLSNTNEKATKQGSEIGDISAV
jgi:hypothetical protein